MKVATFLNWGRNAKRNPESPCITAPVVKQVLAPILAPYLPKMGLQRKHKKCVSFISKLRLVIGLTWKWTVRGWRFRTRSRIRPASRPFWRLLKGRREAAGIVGARGRCTLQHKKRLFYQRFAGNGGTLAWRDVEAQEDISEFAELHFDWNCLLLFLEVCGNWWNFLWQSGRSTTLHNIGQLSTLQ